MEIENGNEIASESQEEEVLETSEEAIDEIDYKLKAEKAEELAENYKIRAEKAEKLAKRKVVEKTTQSGTLDRDIIYITKADIHEDDIEAVSTYASKNDMSMREAHNYLKPIFDINNEKRKTAEATNIGSARKGATKLTGEALLAKAAKGEFPDSPEDLRRLVEAEKGIK